MYLWDLTFFDEEEAIDSEYAKFCLRCIKLRDKIREKLIGIYGVALASFVSIVEELEKAVENTEVKEYKYE